MCKGRQYNIMCDYGVSTIQSDILCTLAVYQNTTRLPAVDTILLKFFANAREIIFDDVNVLLRSIH